jgi:hypothetical protein
LIENKKERTWATMSALFLRPGLVPRQRFFSNPASPVSFAQLPNQQSRTVLYSAREECHIKSKSD